MANPVPAIRWISGIYGTLLRGLEGWKRFSFGCNTSRMGHATDVCQGATVDQCLELS